MAINGSRQYALYLRKSQGRAPLPRQRTLTTAHVEKLGGSVAEVFSDADRTAFRHTLAPRPERKDFDRMLEWLAANPGAGIAAYHADRLLRDIDDTADLIRACVRGGHLIETYGGGSYDLSTATGRKRLRDDASHAAYEVDRNTERIIAQKNEAAAEGKWLGSMRPFGYEGIPAKPGSETKYKGLRVVPGEAAAISSAAQMILEGHSMNSVVRRWNADGIRGTSGGEWTVSNLRRLLLSPRLAGIATHHGQETGPAAWEPILRAEVFRALQVKLGARANPGHSTARKWLGSGLFLCGVCGRPVHVHGGLNGRHKDRSYCCTGHVARRVGAVDEYVTGIVLAYLERGDSAAAVAAASPPPRGEDMMLLTAAVIEVEERRRNFGRQAAMKIMPDDAVAAGMADLQAEIDALNQRIAAASKVSPLAGVVGNRSIRAEWPGYELTRKQAIVAELVTVRIMPVGPGRPKDVPWPQSWFDESLIEIGPGLLLQGRESPAPG